MSQQIERDGKVFTLRNLDEEGLTRREAGQERWASRKKDGVELPEDWDELHSPDWSEPETPEEGRPLNALGNPEDYDDSKRLAAAAKAMAEVPSYPPEKLKGLHEEVIGQLATEASLPKPQGQ